MVKLTQSTQKISTQQFARARDSVSALLKRKDLGFFQILEREELWQQAQIRGNEIRKAFSRLCVLGIGGSSLGGITVRESLSLEGLEFFENVDSHDFWKRLKELGDLSNTHWVIMSKSGRTVETLTQANFVSETLKSQNLSLEKQSTVITELRANPLYDWASRSKVPVLEIPVDVGGRFSVLTSVGLLPAAFAGVEISRIQKGARAAVQNTDLVADLVAHYSQSFENQKWISVFWAYCNSLKSFGLWTEQLWAESLGKRLNRNGGSAPRSSTPISLVGASDQHSVLQQISEGEKDKFITFIRVKESESTGPVLKTNLFEGEDFVVNKSMGDLLAAEAQATQMALQEANVPSLSLELEKLTPESLGYMFMLFELVVGAMGEHMNINAFDQPGVELGKRLAKKILLK